MSTRKWVSEYVPAAFLISACFVVPGSGVALSIVSGVTANVASRPAEQAAGWATRRLSGNKKDDINHDLENAMKRGYVRAVDFLGDVWEKSFQREFKSSLDSDPAELFRILQGDVDKFLTKSRLRAFLNSAESIQSFGQPGLPAKSAQSSTSNQSGLEHRSEKKANPGSQTGFEQPQNLEEFLKPYIEGRADEVGTFLKRQLVPTIALYFGEELKTDTRAWRAFQRIVTDSMLAGFKSLEAGQAQQHAETTAKLEELLKRFDTTPPEQRLNEGLNGLEQRIMSLRDEVTAAIAADGLLTREAIDLIYISLTLQADEQHAVVVGELTTIRDNIERLFGLTEIQAVPEARGKIMEFGGRRLNHFFVGRNELQAWIEQKFAEIGSGSGAAIVLHGLGGIGKTQLALEYASQRQNRYTGIWWMLAESENSLISGYNDLAMRLDLPGSRIVDPQLAAEAARRYLEEREPHDRWLVIFDNANDVGFTDRWLPDRGAVDAIVTSRLSTWDGDRFFIPKQIDVLTPEEASELLRRRTEDPDVASASALAEELGYLPLALEQAAAYVKAMPQVGSLANYLKMYRIDPSRALVHHRPRTGNYRETVGSTWTISMAAVVEELPEASDLMNLFSFLAADAIPLDLIIAHADVLPNQLRVALVDSELRIIEVLNRYSLVSLGPSGNVGIHRLVQRMTRNRLDVDQQVYWGELAVRLALSIFPSTAEKFENWPVADRLLPHVTQILDHLEVRGRLGVERAELLSCVGSFFTSQGGLTRARAMHEEALALRRQVLPVEHPDIATSLNNLAEVMSWQGDLLGARAMHEEALQLRRRVLPTDHPDIATTLSNLGEVMSWQGDLSGAWAMHEEALQLRRRVLPTDHPDIAISLNNLASELRWQGNISGARAMHEEALALRRRVLPSEHPDIAENLNDLALVLKVQGDLSGARAMHEEALALRRRVLPAGHQDIAKSLSNLGLVLECQGDLTSARQMQEEALELRRRVFPAENGSIAMSLNNLAHVMHAQEDLSGARAMHEEALALNRRVLPAEHLDIATNLSYLALVLESQGDLTGARAMYEEALEMRRRVLPSGNPDIAMSLNNLAGVIESQGELVETQALYEEALALMRRVLPAEHPDIGTVRANLDRVNHLIKDQEQAC